MNVDTLLLRQVHPNFMDGDVPTSVAFRPFPNDKEKLSVYDGDLITPEDSYLHWTTQLGNRSAGVWGVDNHEVTKSGLSSAPDPLPDNPAHALIAFTGLSDKEQRKRAKLLLADAIARGCLHKAA